MAGDIVHSDALDEAGGGNGVVIERTVEDIREDSSDCALLKGLVHVR